MPPLATPTKKNISATFFKCSLSQTKFHSDVHVLPSISSVSYSHLVHLMGSVVFSTIPSLYQLNLFCVKEKQKEIVLLFDVIQILHFESKKVFFSSFRFPSVRQMTRTKDG